MSPLEKLIHKILEIHEKTVNWRKVVTVLAAVVVFITSYALTLPAATLDTDTAENEPGLTVNTEAEESRESEAIEPEQLRAETITLTEAGVDYTVTAAFDASSAFPNDVVMSVKEILKDEDPESWQKYYDQAQQAVQANQENEIELSFARFFDITFMSGDQEVEPESAVAVRIKYDNAINVEKPEDVKAVHFDENKAEPEIIDVQTNSESNGEAVNEVYFSAESFSVYAVIGTGDTGPEARVKVVFHNGNTEVASMYVKNSDTEEELKKILYDPGVGEIGKDIVFKGWTKDKNYALNDAENGLSIEDIRTELKDTAITEDMPLIQIDYYAMLYKHYVVSYLDEKEAVIESENILLSVDDEKVEYTITMSHTPPDGEHNFEGWEVKEGGSKIDGFTDGTVYKVGSVITISGDIIFSVNEPLGHWLVFDENGKGATYNAPMFIRAEETTKKPVADNQMMRNGYIFGGWYTDENCTAGNEFVFGNTIDDRTTIYAKWTAKNTANYTVLIWKQNVNGREYDFAESISLSGTSGSIVSSVVRSGTGNDAYVRVNGVDKKYIGFHLDKFDSNVTIVPEGSTVVNVYYNRNLVTLTFYVQNSTWNPSYTEVERMQGLYGSTLSSNGYVWPADYSWYDRADNRTRVTFLDAFIPSNGNTSEQSFIRRDNGGRVPIRFHKENADGIGYTVANTVWVGNGSFRITDKYNGFKAASYFTNDQSYAPVPLEDKNPSTGVYAVVSSGYRSLDIYFERLKYNLIYLDGVFVDANNNPVEGYVGGTKLNEKRDIVFESDMSSYNSGGNNYYVPTKDGFVFEGWYADDQCVQPYTFTTMPQGITVYAKWRQIQYRVFLHPNAGTDSTLDWGSDSVQLNFRVNHNQTISLPTGQRDEYEFVGWYTDTARTHLFNAATKLNETTVTTPYDTNVDLTDPMDKWGNGATENRDKENGRFWITKKLDLYAKWRVKLIGADGIGVQYDANGGSNPPTDTQLYKDGANATAQSASTAPEGKVFKEWVVQKWEADKFVDTDITVLPGNSFEVRKIDSHDVELPESTPANPKHTYTVQLRAEYVDKDKSTPAYIWWYANNKTGAVDKKNDGKDTLFINEATAIKDPDSYAATDPDTLTENQKKLINPGYEFLGWARVSDGNGQDKDLTEDDLFLKYIYNDVEHKYEFKAKVGDAWLPVTQVAADKRQPMQDMYAVWKELPSLTIEKVDAADAQKKLPGAAFELKKMNTDGIYESYHYYADIQYKQKVTAPLVSGSDGRVTAYGLQAGEYQLTEVIAPDGYVIVTNSINFTVAADGSITLKDDIQHARVVDNDAKTRFLQIDNTAGKALPNTGGSGTSGYTLTGIMLIAAALVYGIFLKLRRVHL